MKIDNVKKVYNIRTFLIAYFLVFALSTLLIYIALQWVINMKITNAFPTMEDILEYEDELKAEQFDKIPFGGKNSKLRYIIFAEEGGIVYASDSAIREKIREEDLVFINIYDNRHMYMIAKRETADGVRYRVQETYYDMDTGYTELRTYGILDEDLNVIGGNLFDGRRKLSEREFEFLKGQGNINESVTKYEYIDNRGNGRILVSLSEKMNRKNYEQFAESIRYYRLSIIPIILVLTLIGALIFNKIIKNRILALSKMVVTYRQSETPSIDRKYMPSEFEGVLNRIDELLEEIELTNQERKRIMADLSHDLKTPLSIISACSKAFCEGLVPESENEKYMQMIYGKAQILTVLINDLFDYTKMGHPDYKMYVERVDICEFLREYFAGKYADLEENGFELEFLIPEKKTYVNMDRKLMSRAIENIVNNTLRHNERGTTIYVELTNLKDRVLVSISDNGTSIDANMIKNIFEPFVKNETEESVDSSTGLGLSIVKRVMDMHHGQVYIKIPPETKYSTEMVLVLKKW